MLGRSSLTFAFSDMDGPAQIVRCLGFWAVAVQQKGESGLVFPGVKRTAAEEFAAVLNDCWQQSVRGQVLPFVEELRTLAEVVGRLNQPKRYPSACLLQPFVERADAVLRKLPTELPLGVLSADVQQDLDAVRRLHTEGRPLRHAATDAFISAELDALSDFFDTVESNPLTPEQRLAVVTDEDATLVLAGAGSGKTSVIVTKAAYLVRQGLRDAGEILLMAFGKDAAAEMATRIEERCGVTVDARTFHGLGYEIIRQVESGGPALAAHASDEKGFKAELRKILVEDVVGNPHLQHLLIKWFTEFYFPHKGEWDFEARDEYFRYVEAHELRTLQGELVKSFEEWEIANWLFLNGVTYEYEPVYEHALPENDRRAYTPDFRLTESGVYIEHFGVRKMRGPGGSEWLTTAPFVDRQSYLEGMDWKRKVHADHGTVLVETYSYERVEGRLMEALQEKISPYATPAPLPPEQIFATLSQKGQIDSFTQTLGTFLRHFKSSGTTMQNCRARAEEAADKHRSKAFMDIFQVVYDGYQQRLGDRIDFEDMIVRATGHVTSGRYVSPYRHLLVDEFQDISEGRSKLLLALKQQHADARIFAVGDDWQSIYRFTGADIHLMRDFGRIFGGEFMGEGGIHSTVDLRRTFRSVDKIALPARHFVLKNPSQIEKKVVPAGVTERSAISVSYYQRGADDEALGNVLEQIQAAAGEKMASVLLLGRYHFVAPAILDKLRTRYPRLSVKFMTVHASKGLEADHVVILSANRGRMGFPSEIVDDPLLDLVLPEPEEYAHAEERRLFYVALTRARATVTVMAERERPSVFAQELLDDPAFEAVTLGEADQAGHSCSACGGRMQAQTSKDGRAYYACEHRRLCGTFRKPCNVCGQGLPTADARDASHLICSCGARFPACPDCRDGWLVERVGRYGEFLSCVRYPECKGRGKLAKPEAKEPKRRQRRQKAN